jgi:hypothetical protein
MTKKLTFISQLPYEKMFDKLCEVFKRKFSFKNLYFNERIKDYLLKNKDYKVGRNWRNPILEQRPIFEISEEIEKLFLPDKKPYLVLKITCSHPSCEKQYRIHCIKNQDPILYECDGTKHHEGCNSDFSTLSIHPRIKNQILNCPTLTKAQLDVYVDELMTELGIVHNDGRVKKSL